MIRFKVVLAALFCVGVMSGSASADNAWFSLNLEFNNPANFNSGGTWTVVTKADERGLSGAVLNFQFGSLNFDPLTGFLTPAGFEIAMSGDFGGTRLEIVEGDDFSDRTLDVGVIGGTYPSTYVDDPGLVVFGANADLGSFTGGVELATGSFDPGDIPTWITTGPNRTDASLFLGSTGPGSSPAVFTTVRYVVPEPATLLLAGLSLIGLALRRG